MKLRLATDEDRALCMAWRSNPLIYEGFYVQKKPLIWEEHKAWWASRNQDWRQFIVMNEERPIGVVTIGQLDHWSCEVGYYIGEVSSWGKGYGKKAVELAIEWLRDYGKQYCHTTILDKNERSNRLIKSLGFERLCTAREGESWWQRKL